MNIVRYAVLSNSLLMYSTTYVIYRWFINIIILIDPNKIPSEIIIWSMQLKILIKKYVFKLIQGRSGKLQLAQKKTLKSNLT